MDLLTEFKDIIAVSDTLMGEKGCPWDHKQTFETLKGYLLEESYEVLDAVDEKDDHNLLEELGDLFYIIIFFAKVAEKEKKFTLAEVIARVREKLIYRHPHVFGQMKLDTLEEIKEQWTALKQKEKAHRKNKWEGVPKALPALVRAQKVAEHLESGEGEELDEEILGKKLFELAALAHKHHLNAELALRKEIAKREEAFSKEG